MSRLSTTPLSSACTDWRVTNGEGSTILSPLSAKWMRGSCAEGGSRSVRNHVSSRHAEAAFNQLWVSDSPARHSLRHLLTDDHHPVYHTHPRRRHFIFPAAIPVLRFQSARPNPSISTACPHAAMLRRLSPCAFMPPPARHSSTIHPRPSTASHRGNILRLDAFIKL